MLRYGGGFKSWKDGLQTKNRDPNMQLTKKVISIHFKKVFYSLATNNLIIVIFYFDIWYDKYGQPNLLLNLFYLQILHICLNILLLN